VGRARDGHLLILTNSKLIIYKLKLLFYALLILQTIDRATGKDPNKSDTNTGIQNLLIWRLLVVVWPVVSDMPIYDGFLDVHMFCVLHVLYI
jgi:hypothetical protein